MTVRKAEDMIKKIMKEDCVEVGIFISMLSNEYIKTYDISERDFLRSLKNSLKILKKEEENEKD